MQLKPGIKLLSEVEGNGSLAKRGSLVSVRLDGQPSKGQSIQSNAVSAFVVGGRVVIPGNEYAVDGMRVGGRRKVKISPHLAYKDNGVPGLIPPGAVLIYEIELLSSEQSS
jgi:FKBP-type peptidyl-prolyl cis-trans isomerase